MFSQPLLIASRSARMRRAVTGTPALRRLADRFVAGESLDQAVGATTGLVDRGLTVTIDHLGEDTLDAKDAAATRDAYLALLARLTDLGLPAQVEVSVKLSALGQKLASDAAQVTLENAVAICEAAQRAGTTVTVDMEDHTTVDATLGTVRDLREEFPWVGAVLQSCLRRTEADCADLATAGSRVRLVKGAYAEPATVAYAAKRDVDLAYARCMRILMNSKAYPMIATHDLRMVDIAERLGEELGREPGSYEFQMLYGIRTTEQRALAARGHIVRVYLPYGEDWYGYFMRRLAERPANLAFFARSLFSR
ncbi:proline dehydrogenase family protein [Longispora sp. NPDC051575]|uniref:proline dehydrogenase family protein n=1 Tax=Longispora sp. NPDC051575 TaxID=3154943 RepID=UPI003434A95C